MPSILDGMDEIIDKFFGLEGIGRSSPHYGNRASCEYLSEKQPENLDGLVLLENLYQQIVENRNKYKDNYNKPPSLENWRFTKIPCIADENKSPEVVLERSIIKAADDRWANQVPTSSGLVGPHADKRRAIDLVFKRDEGHFEFIELKINADTPLFAVMEITIYGLLYIFSRNHMQKLGYTKEEKYILTAEQVGLKVLVPVDYYQEYKLRFLERMIDKGLENFLASGDFSMNFRIEMLPESFSKDSKHFKENQIFEAINSQSLLYR